MAFKSVLLFVLFINLSCGDDSRWSNCIDTFCDTLRATTASTHTVDESSIKINDKGKLEARLTPVAPATQSLKLVIALLEEEIFHISIDQETATVPPRFQARDALAKGVEDFNTTKLTKGTVETGKLFSATYDDLGLKIYINPFKVEFYRSDKLISVVNDNNKFVYNTAKGNQNIRLDILFKDARRAYGLPEHADHLALRRTVNEEPYRHFNLDYGSYELESTQALYGTIGVVYAHNTDYSSGAFWLNGAQTWIDINSIPTEIGATFMSESGILDLFVLTGPTLPSAVKQYTTLTGNAPLPQYFTLGYHQSRYSYMTQADVLDVVKKFDENSLPVDVMWLDIDYTEEKQYFTWDPTRFPEPEKLIDDLGSSERKLVAIIDPHIKADMNYFVYSEANAKKYFITNTDGTNFEGECWPGLSSYLDFTNTKAREYYASLYKAYHFQNKNVHVWNDMNEPSVFNLPTSENSIPLTAKQGDYEHRDVHNMYGFYQTVGTREGMLSRPDVEVRPFILTRSHFAGSQRYAAIWTGDNVATWEYLQISFPMCLTEALSGISFCGADVGGFAGIPDDELYQRWYQAGAWLPFYRGHSAIDVPRREPYLYPSDIQNRVRTALNQRYSHIPVWYTLFYEHEQTGEPVIRPITYHYPKENAFDVEYQLLIGSNILAAPVLHKGVVETTVYIPGGKDEVWYNIDENYKPYHGTGYQSIQVSLDSVPIFYKAGSIIFRKDNVKSASTLMHEEAYTLYIVLNGTGYAEGTLYVDDGESYSYQNDNKYFYVNFVFNTGVLKMANLHNTTYDKAAPIGNLVIINPPVNVSSVEKQEDNSMTVLNTTHLDNVILVSNFSAELQNEFEIRLVFSTSSASMLALSSSALFIVILTVIRNL